MYPRLLLALALILGLTSSAHPNGEPPIPPGTGERLSGPATVGTLTISPGPSGLVIVSFSGRCANQEVSFGPNEFPGVLSNVTAERITDMRIIGGVNNPQLQPCYSMAGVVTGDLIINTVTRFNNNGFVATAEVVVMAVVLR